MASEVAISRAAEFDRDRIIQYLIEQFRSPQAASHFMDELDKVIDGLGFNPLLYGCVREEWLAKKGYRKALFVKYVAIFSIEGDSVRIAHIFHQSQDYARLV